MQNLTPKSVLKNADAVYALLAVIADPKGCKKEIDNMVKEAGVIESAKLKKLSVEAAEKLQAEAKGANEKAQAKLAAADVDAELIRVNAEDEVAKLKKDTKAINDAAKARQKELEELVKGKEATLVQMEVGLKSRETRLDKREEGLAGREATVAKGEAELQAKLDQYKAIG